MTPIALMSLAWSLELAVGWPPWLFRHARHPVVWIGALIGALDERLNRPSGSDPRRRALGTASALAVVAVCAAIAALVSWALPNDVPGHALEALIASSLLASRSLHDHVRAVAVPLASGDTSAARAAVGRIVGRDPETLDDGGIARAALESLAENASDGVVAPLFWGALLGLPGLAAYKAVNTLDSMLGHRTERHRDFGRFAAHLDDAVNVVPARLTAALLAVAGGVANRRDTLAREAATHRSPNAGWPESAMAHALGVRLCGPRMYAGVGAEEPWLNAGARDPSGADVARGLRLYTRALLLGAVLMVGVAAALAV